MVMPPVLRLPEIQIAAGGKVGEGSRIIRSWDKSVTVSGVREYHPGDSLRYVHWPTSARKDGFFVRTFDSTPSSDQWIFLDLFGEVQAGEGGQASEEHAIILAASLANDALESGQGVGFGSNGKELVWLLPQFDETQRWKILRALALLEKGDDPLVLLLDTARKVIRFRSSIIIITADLSGSWLDPLLLMRRRGIVPTVLLIDVAAFGGTGKPSALIDQLTGLGINHFLIGPDFLDASQQISIITTQQKPRDLRGRTQQAWRPLT
jgi:uncharacterized protein (DUF58 family)